MRMSRTRPTSVAARRLLMAVRARGSGRDSVGAADRARTGRGGLDAAPVLEHDRRPAEVADVAVRGAFDDEDVRLHARPERTRDAVDPEVPRRPTGRAVDHVGRVEPDPDPGFELEEEVLAEVGEVDADVRAGH